MEKRKLILFIATSLDGYIATKEENLDWLFEVEGEDDNGFSRFYEKVDTVLMGRRTFDWVNRETDDYPYQDKSSYVFTRSKGSAHHSAQFITNHTRFFISNLKQQDGKAIWLIGGGELLSFCLKENLVDEIIVTVAPKIIGSGIPLFREGVNQIDLTLHHVDTFNQFVELHYTVDQKA
ncbi:dihydrofolate reductase family protein [Shouchella sp. JSM 1781072]|uniref:dihydrofolate reductase family protein n=1 Tax=Shouchella sp. JSM 1781072 TaxID=3344581 RepID=UPI0035BEBF7E